jgi:hypothetical protein
MDDRELIPTPKSFDGVTMPMTITLQAGPTETSDHPHYGLRISKGSLLLRDDESEFDSPNGFSPARRQPQQLEDHQ